PKPKETPKPKEEAKPQTPPAKPVPAPVPATPSASEAPSTVKGAPGPAHENAPGTSGDPRGGGGGPGNRTPEFYAYVGHIYRSIKEQWVWGGEQDMSLATTIQFSILADGSITDVRISQRSRNPLYDESAINAV